MQCGSIAEIEKLTSEAEQRTQKNPLHLWWGSRDRSMEEVLLFKKWDLNNRFPMWINKVRFLLDGLIPDEFRYIQ